jgi:general secretion pathway protein A
MSKKKLLGLYGLKWNPFDSDIPLEALHVTSQIDSFCWRVETLTLDGGFAMITGHPGMGKSVTLRILNHRLTQIPEAQVGTITRPQSGVADFYREMGDLFGLEMKISNRWNGYKSLRKKWREHIQSTLYRPVLLIDEAQETLPQVLNELRLLSSTEFDSKMILTIILCGDQRLPEKFKSPDLIPLGSRIRVRLNHESLSKKELLKLLQFLLEKSGNPKLMTDPLKDLLADHAAGNPRVMMIMAANLLAEAVTKEAHTLDEKLFFETYNSQKRKARKA